MMIRSGWVFSLLALILLSATTSADRIHQALRHSTTSGRPLLVIGSSESCGPCRRLQAEMNSRDLQDVLNQCVVLKLDGRSSEFAKFVRRFPADARLLPMVYVILPDETPMYAQSGSMSGEALKGLLAEAISYSTTIPASEPSADYQTILATARTRAKSGELIEAMQQLQQLSGHQLPAEIQVKFLTYQDRLKSAMQQWLSDLDQQMQRGKLVHGAAYRIAEVYLELSAYKEVHAAAGKLLRRYENQTETSTAVLQAKHLLVARYHEEHRLGHKAMRHYLRVVTIDDTSPAGYYAKERMTKLRRKLADKLLSKNSLN